MSEQGTTKDLSSVRKRAWATRRAKYGQLGYGPGAYQGNRGQSWWRVQRALEEISRARCKLQLLLPEKAAHHAITCIDSAVELLEQR